VVGLRFVVLLELLREDFEAGLRRGLVLRDREVEVLRPVLRLVVLRVLDEDVLLLRDPGGEDVRVAMVTTLRSSHSSHRDHRGACLAGGACVVPDVNVVPPAVPGHFRQVRRGCG
jgi:hypothetical protein